MLSTTLFKKETRADLREDGAVEWRRDDGETLTFKTVSEFRLAVVRERNPERKVDNGWDWVKYEGKKLGEYKRLLPPPPPPSSPKKREPRAPKSPTPKKRRKKLDDDERMYSMNVKISNAPVREKRERRSASRGVFEAFDDRGQDLQMVTCSKYNGRSRKQPFEITITRAAELVMDFHAHLAATKSSGFWEACTTRRRRRCASRERCRRDRFDKSTLVWRLNSIRKVCPRSSKRSPRTASASSAGTTLIPCSRRNRLFETLRINSPIS